MRVYLPTTLRGLATAYGAGGFAPAPLEAHAVTPAIREWYVSGDLEELEYAALTEAAEASLRALAASGDASFRRVVVAADVPEAAVGPRPDERFRSAVTVATQVPLEDVASVHVDEPEAADVVSAAAAALPAADAGDDDAQFAVDEAEATELLWYDVTEVPDLLS
jgi:FMN phosphatase YigB (HAD superfamily)